MSEQSAAPQSPAEKMSVLANSMLAESDQDNPNAWEGEPNDPPQAEGEAAPETPETEKEAEPSQSESDLAEIEIGGQKYQVPKAVAEGYMKDSDYRQKTMALAEDRKGVEQVKATFSQLAQQADHLARQAAQFAPAFGQITAMDGQIHALHSQLTPQLEATDPVSFSVIAAKVNMLMQQRHGYAQQVDQAMKQHQAQLAEVNGKANLERVQRAMPSLNKAIPGGYTKEAAKRAQDYLVNSGLAAELNEVLPGAMDTLNYLPQAVLTMWKAAEYDRQQAEAKVSLKKVEGLPPVARPGAKVQSSEQKAKAEKMRDRFRESGGKDSNLSRALIANRIFGGS